MTSQDYPSAYNQTSDCYWTIRVPQGQRVKLKFATFMVGPEEGSCTQNYVELVDGVVNPNVRRLIPRFPIHDPLFPFIDLFLGSVAIPSPQCTPPVLMLSPYTMSQTLTIQVG